MMAEMDQMHSDTGKISVRNCIDTFMERLGKLLHAARRSNVSNLRKRYANYERLPPLRTRTKRGSASEEHEHPKDEPASIAHIMDDTRQEARQTRSAAQRWIRDPNNLDTYIKLVRASDTGSG